MSPEVIAVSLAIVWAAIKGRCLTCKNEGPPHQYDGDFPLPDDVPRCVTCKAPMFRCSECRQMVSWSQGMADVDDCAECAMVDGTATVIGVETRSSPQRRIEHRPIVAGRVS